MFFKQRVNDDASISYFFGCGGHGKAGRQAGKALIQHLRGDFGAVRLDIEPEFGRIARRPHMQDTGRAQREAQPVRAVGRRNRLAQGGEKGGKLRRIRL